MQTPRPVSAPLLTSLALGLSLSVLPTPPTSPSLPPALACHPGSCLHASLFQWKAAIHKGTSLLERNCLLPAKDKCRHTKQYQARLHIKGNPAWACQEQGCLWALPFSLVSILRAHRARGAPTRPPHSPSTPVYSDTWSSDSPWIWPRPLEWSRMPSVLKCWAIRKENPWEIFTLWTLFE